MEGAAWSDGTPTVTPPIANTQVDNKHATWASFNSGTVHPVYVTQGDGVHAHNPQFTISATPMGSIAHSYMEDEGVWIVPKQNKIRVGCKLEGELAQRLKGNEVAFVQVNNECIGIDRFIFTVDAMRMVGGRVSDERAPLFAMNAQKHMAIPDIVYISPIPSSNLNTAVEVVWHKLQFTAPTIGNSDKSSPREKFHFVISLIAEVNKNGQTAHYTISSIVSPAMIVIGQNPARFKRSKLKQQQSNAFVSSINPSEPTLPSNTVFPSPTPHFDTSSFPNTKKRRADSSQSLPSYHSNTPYTDTPSSFALENFHQTNILPSPLSPTSSMLDLDNSNATPSLSPASLTLPSSSVQAPSLSHISFPPHQPSAGAHHFFVESQVPLVSQDSSIFLQDPNSAVMTVFHPQQPTSSPIHSYSSPVQLQSYPSPIHSHSSPENAYSSPVSNASSSPSPSQPLSSSSPYSPSPSPSPSPGSSASYDDSNGTQQHVMTGKVGINCHPHEALTVGGNIFYTGDLVKPSDRRIKRNIVPLSALHAKTNNTGTGTGTGTGTVTGYHPHPHHHRDTLSSIKLYEYERVDLGSTEIRYIKERGVLAQEVQQAIPSAVIQLNNVMLPDGTIVPNLLAVNDRELLIETIGATQELSNETDHIHNRVEYLNSITEHHGSLLQTLSNGIASVRQSERGNRDSFLSIIKKHQINYVIT